MHQSLDYDKLKILFSRASTLPPLPQATARLIAEIDSDQTSAARLEKVIAADPNLVVEVIRVAGKSSGGDGSNPVCIRQAILLLGQRSLRSVAISLSLKRLARQDFSSRRFNAIRFARHSLFVAIFARYLHARGFRKDGFVEENWTGEELFAAGILHDLGLSLLASVDPSGYDRVWTVGQALRVSLADAFFRCYGGDISALGAAAAEAWGFPGALIDSQRHLGDPIALPAQMKGLCCLNYADNLATRFGEGHCEWEVGTPPDTLVSSVIQIPDDELQTAGECIRVSVTELLCDCPSARVAA